MTHKPKLMFVPSEPLQRSGVQILAERWARLTSARGWDVQIIDAPDLGLAGRTVERALQGLRTDDICVVLGLPALREDAQDVIDAIVSCSHRVILLWERAGHCEESASEALMRLDGIREAWVLNPLLLNAAKLSLPNADVNVSAVGIPNIFFDLKVADTRPIQAYAAYVGRFSDSKGAPALARRWAESVYAKTGLRLVLAGKGLSTGSGEYEIAALDQRHPAISAIRLMSEESRAKFLANASLAVFPAVHDYFPQTLAETLAVATPVIATDIPGHNSLAPPGQVSAVLSTNLFNLDEMVIHVLAHPVEAALRASVGRARVYAQQSEDATADRLKSLLLSQLPPL